MRMQLTRDFYVPKNARPIDCGDSDAAVYIYETERNGRSIPLAIAFHGKAAKPDWHHSFANNEARQKRIDLHLAARKATADYKAKARADRSKPHTLTVGTILVCSWGYDQTNIDYYQVTRIIGPLSVEIRPIAAHSTGEDGFMTAHCTAVRDAFKGEPMIKRCNSSNCVKISSYSSASPWDGKPDRYSWYA